MSITQARTLIVKHHKYAWVLTLSAIFVISGVYFRDTVTHAATYYFQQTSWSGGVSASTATHSSNQNSGWSTYDSASSTLTIGDNIVLAPVSSSFTDDGTLTTTGAATGGGFGNGTVSNTLAADTTTSDGHVVLGRDSSSALASYSLDSVCGTYTSVHMVSTSTVFMSYYCASGSDLKFAKTINGGATWTTSTVDSTGAVGLGTSIYAIDSSNIYISYYDSTNTNLKFAKSVDGGSTWSTATIDSSASVGTLNSMDGDGNGTLYISYVDATNSLDKFVKYAKSTDSGETWTVGTIDNPTSYNLYDVKTSIDVLSATTVFVTYSQSAGPVKFAKTTDGGTTWTYVEVSGVSGSMGSSAITATDANTLFMVFDNGSNNTSDLKFATSTNAGTNWTVSNIDTATVAGGAFAKAIHAVDANTLFVAYIDSTNSDLEFAKSTNGGSSWTLQTIESATAAGKDLDIHGFGSTALFISHYESTAVDLKFATYPFATTGTFTSAPINLGGPSVFNVVSWNATLNGQTITMKVRSDSNSNMSGATAWASCSTVSNGGNASDGGCVTDGHQYVQYQATLNGTTSVTPVLEDVTVNHSEYYPLGSLVSSAYNSESDANIMGGITWTEDATLPSGTTATLYLRTSATSDLSGSSWSTGITSGATGCSKSGTTVTCTTEAIDSALRDGLNDQWFQYKVTLTSSGASTPTVDNVQVAYVVNGPPTFDTTYSATGVITSQNTTIGDTDYGKVNISYRVGDIDTASFTPSFKYSVNGGSSWSDIPSNDLSADATSLKTYTGGATTTFSVVWNATSTLSASPVNIANAKVRVTANDGDVANNIGTADSAEFTLDTIAPSVASGNFVVDSSVDGAGSAGTPGDNRAGIKLYATDYSTIQYRLCNDSSFPATDAQGNSCAWSSLSASPVSLATSSTQWITTGYPSAETVYMQVRDAYGNVTAETASAPAMPGNFDYKDVSNTDIDVYREFLSWSVFSATDSSTFSGDSSGRYKLYHAVAASGDPEPSSSSYSAVTSISDPTINYATHNITSATTSVHYYKAVAMNDQGSISDFTAVLSDIPNGSGGAVSLPPQITDTPTADNIKNTSARITFTSDMLATSTVEYGTTNSYGSTAYQTSFVENHSLYLNSLSPNTSYYFRAKATNAEGQDSDWAVGTTFTTAQGTVISGVTPMNVTDKTATIFWNTNASSTSKVYYGTDRSGSTLVGSVTVTGTSATTAGSNGLYQHQVGIPSSGAFTAGNTYYYKVESTDGDGNTTTDDNNGQFYSFTTTLDTTAPTISDISAAVVGPTSAVIVWTTDEPATSQVRWSGTTGNHSKRTTTDMTYAGIASYSVYHVATLSSQTQNVGEGGGTNVLIAETPYYYTVVSADAAGNETESAEQTFTTTRTGEDVIVTVSRSLPQGAEGSGPTADTTSPVVTNMKVSDITPFTATVTFDTSEASVGKLGYSKDTSYGDHAADDFSWGTKHSIKLRGLTLGTQYHIKASVVDKAGNTGYSEEQTFKTSFLSENVKELSKIENIEQFQKEIEETIESILPSLVPPFVSKPTITDITESGATISFKTNIKAFPLVGFVEDGTYDASKENPYTSEVSDTTEKATNHTLALLNLKPNTKYHVQARAFSLPQVVGKSEDLTFTTQASKIQGSIVDAKRDSFTVVWITSEPTTSIVEYKDLSSGITQRKADERKTTSHSMKIENLSSGTTFEVNISGLNEGGNLIEGGNTLRVTTSRDVTPPVISNFKVSNAMVPGRTDRIQTIISWTTDEPANSVVYFEEGIGTTGAEEKELANKSEVLDAYVMDHNIIISSLKPGAIYRIKVTSLDESDNLGVFGPRTIITPKQTESITDIIFKNFEDSFKFLRDM